MSIIIFVSMTLLGAFGAICLKVSTQKGVGIKGLIFNKWVYLGGVLYFTSALINIYLLKVFEYSVFLPMTSITYIWSILLARLFLNENINKYKVISVILIITGVVFIAS